MKEYHASVIPLTGFSPISHKGHAQDLGETLSKLPGEKHVGISSKAETFSPEERKDILNRQWGESNKGLNVHIDNSAGSVVSKAFHALPKDGKRVLHLLVGHDRKDFVEKLKDSLENGKIKEMNGEKWDEIHIHYPEDEDRGHGMSGTKMRQAAASGDTATFRKHLGSNFTPEESDKIQSKMKSAIDSGELAVKRPDPTPKKKKALKEMLSSIYDMLLEGGNVKIKTASGEEVGADTMEVTPENREHHKSDITKALSDLHDSFKKATGKDLFGKNKKALTNRSIYSGSTHHLMNSDISDEEFAKHKPKVGDVDVMVPQEHADALHEHIKPGMILGDHEVVGTKRSGSEIHMLMRHRKTGKVTQVDLEKTEYHNDEPTEFSQFAHNSNWEDVKNGIKGVHHKLLMNAVAGSVEDDPHKFSSLYGIGSRAEKKPTWENNLHKIREKIFGKDADHESMKSFHGVVSLIKKHIPKEKHQEIYNKMKSDIEARKDLKDSPGAKAALAHMRKHLSLEQNESRLTYRKFMSKLQEYKCCDDMDEDDDNDDDKDDCEVEADVMSQRSLGDMINLMKAAIMMKAYSPEELESLTGMKADKDDEDDKPKKASSSEMSKKAKKIAEEVIVENFGEEVLTELQDSGDFTKMCLSLIPHIREFENTMMFS